MTTTTSVVVPTHDRPEQLGRLVECMCRQCRLPDQLVIVNDGRGKIDTRLLNQAESAGIVVSVIRREKPSSAASRNAGFAAATGDIVICLDDDMVPEDSFIRALVDLYQKDTEGVVSGIGVPYQEEDQSWKYKLWETFSFITGRMRFRPRVRASSYINPGTALSQLLKPAMMMSGGAMSLRGHVARYVGFNESMGPYSFGEDREFSYRVGRTEPLYTAQKLQILHCPGPGGRGSWLNRGRVYVANILHIVRTSVEPGAGTTLLVSLDLAGAFFQHLLWGVLTAGRHNLLFAAGMAQQLISLCVSGVRRIL